MKSAISMPTYLQDMEENGKQNEVQGGVGPAWLKVVGFITGSTALPSVIKQIPPQEMHSIILLIGLVALGMQIIQRADRIILAVGDAWSKVAGANVKDRVPDKRRAKTTHET